MEIFRQTDLGAFLARHTASERQEQFQRYLMDFLLLSMKVSTWQELKVCRLGAAGSRWCGPGRARGLLLCEAAAAECACCWLRAGV